MRPNEYLAAHPVQAMLAKLLRSSAQYLWSVTPIVALFACTVYVSKRMIDTSADRTLSSLELTLYQVISVALGIGASFMAGQKQARTAAADVVRPHAKSAFRRVIAVYRDLSQFGAAVEGSRTILENMTDANGKLSLPQVNSVLDALSNQIRATLGTVNDAADDWRDLVPDDVDELEQRAASLKGDS